MSILETLNEGRLIRGDWSSTDQHGRQLLCLYTALAGDPEARPGSCPSELAPQWLAHLLPWWDDAGTAEAWPAIVRRVAALAPRFGELTGEVGTRALARCQIATLSEAMRYVGASSDAACQVINLWRDVESGTPVEPADWLAAEEAARSASAWSAAWSAWSARSTAQVTQVAQVAHVAAASAWSAAWSETQVAQVAQVAAAKAADHIINAHLDAIELTLCVGQVNI